MDSQIQEVTDRVKEAGKRLSQVKEEIGKVIVGQSPLIDGMLIGLLANGHVLVEGMPGLAKTLAVTTLSKVLSCDFKRIQLTPDLLPADLIGTSIYQPSEGTFSVQKGPIFTNILLADEINRAPAKVQSALLEVMQEHQATISGTTFLTGNPFMVLATQNPIEHEGTYPLPEAQTDRFMLKIKVDYPSREQEKVIVDRMGRISDFPEVHAVMNTEQILQTRKLVDQIYFDEKVMDYLLNIIIATREPQKFGVKIEGLLQYGASPRASINLKMAAKAHAFLNERGYVTPHDIKSVAHDVLRHRLRRTYEAEAEEVSSDDIIETILKTLFVP